MTDQEETEQWRLMHVLSGDHRKPGLCSKQCGDPMCEIGCLRQGASEYFRAAIMHGVETLRLNGDSRFPLIVPTTQLSAKNCQNNTPCHDPVCQVVGCMSVPGYNFRELIKIAQQEKLIKVLQK